jgi:hypothetical protein
MRFLPYSGSPESNAVFEATLSVRLCGGDGLGMWPAGRLSPRRVVFPDEMRECGDRG